LNTPSTRAMVSMLAISIAVFLAAILVAAIQPGRVGGTRTVATPSRSPSSSAPASTPGYAAPAPYSAAPNSAAPGGGGLAGASGTTPSTLPTAVEGNAIERTNPSVEDPSRLAFTVGRTSVLVPALALAVAAALLAVSRRRAQVC